MTRARGRQVPAPSQQQRGTVVCPSCHKPTQQNRRDDVTVDRCDDCTLTWFDRDELEQDVQTMPRPQGLDPIPPSALGPEALGESNYRCPICNERMIRVGYVAAPQLRMDLCETHGALVSDEQLHLLGRELVKASGQHTSHDDTNPLGGAMVGLLTLGDIVATVVRTISLLAK